MTAMARDDGDLPSSSVFLVSFVVNAFLPISVNHRLVFNCHCLALLAILAIFLGVPAFFRRFDENKTLLPFRPLGHPTFSTGPPRLFHWVTQGFDWATQRSPFAPSVFQLSLLAILALLTISSWPLSRKLMGHNPLKSNSRLSPGFWFCFC
jgi:flagellar biogenesis protein FliO